MQSILTEIAALLATVSSLPVRVSVPIPQTEALFVWPWRVDLDQATGAGRSPSRNPTVPLQPSPVRIQLMLIAQQADRTQSLATLLACGRVLETNPVVQVSDAEGRIVLAILPTSDLCGVFTASGVLMQPCLSYSLSVVSQNT
jgi:hypothetical protein